MTLLVALQHLTCLSHFSAPSVRALVRRVVELSHVSLSSAATVKVFVLGGLRWLQSVWVIQLLVAATPLTLWLRVLSYYDHPVLDLVVQEHEKTPSYAAHIRIAAFGLQRDSA